MQMPRNGFGWVVDELIITIIVMTILPFLVLCVEVLGTYQRRWEFLYVWYDWIGL